MPDGHILLPDNPQLLPYTPSIYETSPIYPVLPKGNNKSNICPLHRKCIPDPSGYNEYPEDNVPLP